MPLEDDIAGGRRLRRKPLPVPRSLVPHLNETAILLDIDGTLLDLMPTPREVWVPPGLAKTLNRLVERTIGALALVSGRSLNDIDLIFAPDEFPRGRRPWRGNAARNRQRGGRRACAADGQGIEAAACGDRQARARASCSRTRAIRWRCIIASRRMRRRRSMKRCR